MLDCTLARFGDRRRCNDRDALDARAPKRLKRTFDKRYAADGRERFIRRTDTMREFAVDGASRRDNGRFEVQALMTVVNADIRFLSSPAFSRPPIEESLV